MAGDDMLRAWRNFFQPVDAGHHLADGEDDDAGDDHDGRKAPDNGRRGADLQRTPTGEIDRGRAVAADIHEHQLRKRLGAGCQQ